MSADGKPDLDAVVARVWEAIGQFSAEVAISGRLAPPQYLTDAVNALAAVSRPAEARGEPEVTQWQWCDPDDGWVNCDYPWIEQMRETGIDQRYAIRALYAHPAPSGGDAAPRPETEEVSEAMVEAGVEGWIAAINDSHSLARMEHEVSRHEIVGRILRAALGAREPRP